jgi:hypothetical protein
VWRLKGITQDVDIFSRSRRGAVVAIISSTPLAQDTMAANGWVGVRFTAGNGTEFSFRYPGCGRKGYCSNGYKSWSAVMSSAFTIFSSPSVGLLLLLHVEVSFE